MRRGLAPRRVDRSGATDLLFARLTEGDLAQIQSALGPAERAVWDAAADHERRRLALSFGLLHSVPDVAERTGLTAADPPNEVHSMVHASASELGGAYYLADLVFDALGDLDAAQGAGAAALDFSCSSGRVIRPLAAALPEVHWYGCDPNADAITWAAAHVPEIEFSVSSTSPPLPFAEAEFDLVFAISVWSHYSAAAAVRWLDELHRIVRPSGHALITTHGLQACVWFTQIPDRAIEQRIGPNWVAETAERLQRDRHCFWDVFGDHGDSGVVDPEWGLAFFTPEWLLENVTPRWAVRAYWLGGAHGNQDVYVIERP